VCEHKVTQPDAVQACQGFQSAVKVPPLQTHVKVLGSYVWDTEADHGWMEIHPATSIVKE
jgi:hypothetical protein